MDKSRRNTALAHLGSQFMCLVSLSSHFLLQHWGREGSDTSITTSKSVFSISMVKSPPYSFVLAWSPALDPPSSSPEDPFVLWSLRLIKSQLQPLWQPSHTSPSYSFLAKLHPSVTTMFVTCCLLLLSYCMYLQKVPWPPAQTSKWKFLICFLASGLWHL